MAEDLHVGLIRREPTLAAEEREAMLEFGARPDGLPSLLDQPSHRPQRPPPEAARANVLESAHLQQIQPIRLFERPPELPLVDDFGKVEERAGDGGDGNPRFDRPIGGMNASVMHDNATNDLAAPSAGRNFDGVAKTNKTPEGGGAPVAQQRIRPKSKYSSEPLAAEIDPGATEGVNAAMDDPKPAGFPPSVDCASTQSGAN